MSKKKPAPCKDCATRKRQGLSPLCPLHYLAARENVPPKHRGYAPIPSPDSVLYVRGLTDELAATLDRLDSAHGLGGRAATVRAVFSAVAASESLRKVLGRVLEARGGA